ncbi:MAG: biopolymer transporter ExbD [Candidatus Krumholzibacteriota bacterium]|nr:biopolymer transporter ExbD [Candidatus Krumholzibacteriota bacterium]
MADTQPAQPRRPITEEEYALTRPKRRVRIRVDLTPMVDVAFLLLIFFMVTTVFRRPLAMEVNMPEPGATVEVPESNVMTVLVDRDEAMFCRQGDGALRPVRWEELDDLFVAGQEANPDLIILVKIHRDARYESMVEMMDTLDEAHMNRFSLVPMRAEDERLLEEEP